MHRNNHKFTRRAKRSRRPLIITVLLISVLVIASGIWFWIGSGKSALRDHAQSTAIPTVSNEEKTYRKQLATKLTFIYGAKNTLVSSTDIASWYGINRSVDKAKIIAYIQNLGVSLGIQIKNTDAAADSVVAALQSQKSTSIALEKQIVAQKTYTYCTDVRNVDPSNVAALQTKLQSTYADPRGWGMDGLVAFKAGTSGCDFTVWLSSDDQMTSFGGVCDITWSCRSGDNVVLNIDRWLGASPSWNAAGGTLEEYRSMLINHETGHRLGFSHRQCSGVGNAAPVMQQQSIDLSGCTFNAWPSPAEISTFHTMLGL